MNNILEKINSKSVVCGIASEEVALAKSLVDNKCENKKLFITEGLWAVEKLIEKGFNVPLFLFNAEGLNLASDKELNLVFKMTEYAKKSCAVSQKACKKISDRDGFDEFFVVAEYKETTFKTIEELIKNKKDVMGIVMDGLEQPGNIGAILRSFDCAGGDFAIITNKQARINNSRLVRSSLGASFMLPVIEAEIGETQKWLESNNFKCVVTDLTATKNYREIDYNGNIAIVAGNEHTGISASWRKVKGAQSIIIPMLGSCESLNVGFASTLVAYEAGMQRAEHKPHKK